MGNGVGKEYIGLCIYIYIYMYVYAYVYANN